MTMKTLNRKSLARGIFCGSLVSACFWGVALLIAASFVSGCSSSVPKRVEIIGVAGTNYAAVVVNGRPMAPGSYRVQVVSPGVANVYARGKLIGQGRFSVVSSRPDPIRIDIHPGSGNVVITP